MNEEEKTKLAKDTELAHERFKEAWERSPMKVRSIFYKKVGFTRSNMTGILRNGRPLAVLESLLQSLKDSSDEHLNSLEVINETIQAI